MKRTQYLGALREEAVGHQETVMGWVENKRDMGGVIFVDMRDREGTLQVVFDAGYLKGEDFQTAQRLRLESVIAVTGVIRHRDETTFNPRLATGTIELAARQLEVLSQAAPLPFALDEGENVREELRLTYRFLDLRRPRMLANLRFRHAVQKAAQDFLDQAGFIEVETPMLTKSTPEGARDYLVPSRVHPGTFYALPQSPQIFKQLLMVGGVDKYYQIARCFRDEDLRADRQPEFTQVDMEMSFVDQEDILCHLETMFQHIFYQVMGKRIEEPFKRITWTEAMDRYGSDKPDLRFDLPIVDLTDLCAGCGFSVFRKAVEAGGVVRAINAKQCGDFTRSAIEELTQKAMGLGAKGMAWIAVKDNGELYSILTKYFTQAEMQELLTRMEAEPGDFILFAADSLANVRSILGGLRLELGDMLDLRPRDEFCFLFVTDFPQFEYSEEEKRYVAMHHPFTMPYPEDLPLLKTDPAKVRAQAYDVVLNGVELGSGSIRIHRQDIQQAMFEALGFSHEEIQDRFGFMVNAFQYGTPPHGGFAFGLDRLVMLLLGERSLREVIAFPKIKDASCPMTQAPSPVDASQLEVLHLGAEARTEKTKRAENQAAKIDVDHVADLAKLHLTQEEKETMAQEMEDMVAFANQLAAIDTDGVAQSATAMKLDSVFRPDIPGEPLERDALLANAKTIGGGYIIVPRVVE